MKLQTDITLAEISLVIVTKLLEAFESGWSRTPCLAFTRL